ncbi:methyltransferase domain-containing protein [Lacihabitans sp. CCS-44]|uniref:methyltransferase domain-containing protein n=1 Tax=Lacihabitans sp. CCS-44 TaxID=2487331 RepID=UPI0020CC05F3|nr:methyltransferase domain-containing protein [Lacihabitans sp. CCS-44]MCP9754053.1 methyltransferase domain-containing protein [Lacihabitans sp. CCS-44]
MTKSYQKELLDADEIPEADLIQNLKELKFINTYLGGHDVIKKGLRKFEKESHKILEIGSGGGDNLMMLKKHFPENDYAGLDIKEVCVNYSQSLDSGIKWIKEDYKKHLPERPYDLIFNSLFCHHFDDNSVVEMLIWINQNSKKGFFIGDLHRHRLAYFSIKFLTKLFSKSYLVKNDAPLSVQRGFTKKEWVIMLEKAGIENYQITWCWAFRHLIVVRK